MGVDVAVRGRRGMLRDLVVHLIESHDLTTLSQDPDDEVSAVVVLVDPDDWTTDDHGGERFIVMRSAFGGDVVLDDLRRGADAVFGPDVTADDFVTAVRVVAAGGCWLPPALTRSVVDALRTQHRAATTPELTPRERDILVSAAEGRSVKQTARHLGIAPKTVENLQSRMFRKLGVRNRAQAVARAHAAGLLPPDLP